MSEAGILAPVVLLVAWTQVMWFWLYITRVPAVMNAKIKLDPNAPRGQQMSTLPAKVRWKADNYNHLMEQPTIFYAVAISLAVLGEGGGLNEMMAWSYLAIRIVHSLVQALVNVIAIRFVLFSISNIPLVILIISAVGAVL